MSNPQEYNGHKSYENWLLHVWMNPETPREVKLIMAALSSLQEQVKDKLTDIGYSEAFAGLCQDLFRGAIENIDDRDLIESMDSSLCYQTSRPRP